MHATVSGFTLVSSMRCSHLPASALLPALAKAEMTDVNEISVASSPVSSIVVRSASAFLGCVCDMAAITVLYEHASGAGRPSPSRSIAVSMLPAEVRSPIAQWALSWILHATTSTGMPCARIRANQERTASGGLRLDSAAKTLLYMAAVGSSLRSVQRRSMSTAAASTPRLSMSAEKAMLIMRTFTHSADEKICSALPHSLLRMQTTICASASS